MPSETIPDMAMTMKEILDKHSRGIELPYREPIYEINSYEDLELFSAPEIEKMSVLDRIDLARDIKQFIKDTRDGVKQRAQPKDKTETNWAELPKKILDSIRNGLKETIDDAEMVE